MICQFANFIANVIWSLSAACWQWANDASSSWIARILIFVPTTVLEFPLNLHHFWNVSLLFVPKNLFLAHGILPISKPLVFVKHLSNETCWTNQICAQRLDIKAPIVFDILSSKYVSKYKEWKTAVCLLWEGATYGLICPRIASSHYPPIVSWPEKAIQISQFIHFSAL